MRRAAQRAIEARRVSSRRATHASGRGPWFHGGRHSDGTIRHQHRPGFADSCGWVTDPTGPASHRDRVPIAGKTALSAHFFHFSGALRHPPRAGSDSRPSSSQRCGRSLIRPKPSLRILRCHTALTRTIHEYLFRRPILSPGGAFLVRPPRRTASTPASALLAKSPGGLRSRTPRDGIHE